MNKAELYNLFPDDLKGAIRAYEPLEDKTAEDLYKALMAIREKFDLSPWHPLTAFIKKFALSRRSGRPLEAHNVWISLINKDDDYTNEHIEWANVLIHVHMGGVVKDVHAAIWPDKEKLWSYQTEYCVTNITVLRPETKIRTPQILSKGWLMDQAIDVIRKTGNSHKIVELHYHVGSEETLRYGRNKGRRHMRRSTRAQRKQTLTLKDVLTPDPEEPKADKSVFGVMSLDTSTPMTPIKTGVLEPGDSEILLTMLEMAGRKLEELGMHHTLQRWRAAIRRLTQTNETDKIQTETQTQTAAETD